MNPVVINLVGLGSDIIGAVLLFKYGLPSNVVHPDNEYVGISIGDEKPDWYAPQLRKYNRHLLLSRAGLSLLIIGFLLQALASYTTR